MDPITNLTSIAEYLFILVVISGIGLLGIFSLVYVFILWFKFHNREEQSLNFVLLEVSVPRDNEVKIDAAEQMFASLYSIKKSGFWSRFKAQNHISFELVAKKEDIRFYVCLPNNLRDLVEKEIHGAYPGAEVKEVDEYNIFSEKGKVAFTEMKLKSSSYYPIKVYKELPTDSLSSLTSSLAKMGEDEGAAIQIIVAPASKGWQAAGKAYVAKVKKAEADPESAKYNVDPKDLEAIENKCSKVGFETTIRIVVSSKTKESAQAHLDNISSNFAQFTSGLNGFKKKKWVLFKKALWLILFIDINQFLARKVF